MSHGIAIVGLACRYPDARSPSELWENVLAGRRAFRRLPPERLRLEDYLSADRTDGDRIYSTEAAVIEGWEFDRVRFKVAGASYRSADLAHWLALDVAALALADAGFADGDGLPRTTTGVVLGNTLTGEFSRANGLRLRWPFVRRVVGAALPEEGMEGGEVESFLARLEGEFKRPFAPMTEETLAGGLSNTIAGRIANHFDLGGGGYTVDGACSSSLLAACQACSSLVAGDLDLALAGGVDLSIDPFELVGFARAGALAAGEMRVYDARSAGFIPGEGCGFVVLLREEDALAQGRRIYAVIRGWGISSDGAGGITRPEADGQLRALDRAYARAGFGPERVGYFEGHGTGTAVGDATELEVLSRARRAAGPDLPPAPVGSIKANIGHTKAAAGAASLLKATLALHHQVLPPTTGCDEPHPLLQGEKPALRVLAKGELWPAGQPLVASVSAMGFGGINTHLVLEGAPRERRRRLTTGERRLLGTWQDAELLALSGRDREDLAARAGRLAVVAARISRAELTDLAARLAQEPAVGGARAAVVAATPAEAAARLATLQSWLEPGGLPDSRPERIEPRQGIFVSTRPRPGGPRIGLLFPGQGAPSYLDLRGGALARRLEAVTELYRRASLPTTGDGANTAVAQPAIVTASRAALAALGTLGIEGDLAVGHSLGELSALAWAGAVSEDMLLHLARERGRAMSELGSGSGAMAGIAADAGSAARFLPADGAAVTGYNGPRQTVISGEATAVEEAVRAARAAGVPATRLKVSHAFHSPLVAAAAPCIASVLVGQTVAPLERPVASTITGRLLEPGDDLGALVIAQITSPVLFEQAVEAVAGEVDLWLEVGPGEILSGLLDGWIDTPAVALDAGGPSLRGWLAAAGAAYCLGAEVDLGALFADRFTRPFDLDREPRFLVNPCELAPLPTGPALPREAPRPLPAEAVPSAPSEPAAAAGSAPLEVVRSLVAARAELPLAAVGDDSRLLSDLHLNSISVGQLVAEAARRLGLAPPASPTDFANATVRQVAEALAEQTLRATAGRKQEEALPQGVEAWVRPFAIDWVERALEPPPAAGRKSAGAASGAAWKVVAAPGHPLADLLAQALPPLAGGVALCLPANASEASPGLLLEAARAAIAGATLFVVVQEGGGGGGLARTFFREHPAVPTLVVGVPYGDPRAAGWVAAEAAAAPAGFREARYDGEGRRLEPVLRLLALDPDAAPPLGREDVMLVTGGGKGIAAECALALARQTGARLGLVGRSRPEADAELAGNLERFAAAGIEVHYEPADVSNAAAVAQAVAAIEARLGPVTAFLHGAGRNVPRLLASLDVESFEATIAPKVWGFDNTLAALDPSRLKLVVAFGSIIARIGLVGEADYAVANEWLAQRVESLAERYPACRCLSLDWSVWSGVGMGERLGSVESLLAEGVTPIPPDVGVELCCRLVSQPAVPAAVVVAGRFGRPLTLGFDLPELPFLRFLERAPVFVPGVELVAEAELSAATDPYLADHMFRGELLLPAVLGLEAMAQAATALTGSRRLPTFENVDLPRPIVVPASGTTVLRIAALQRSPGVVEVVLRSDSDSFQSDRFRALCRFEEALDNGASHLAGGVTADESPVALAPATDLYDGKVLFHRGRFQRVGGYGRLTATECLAEISADGLATWFGHYLPGRLLLGDPAARDAAIHGLQACIPHATILPTGADRIVPGVLDPSAPLSLAARERSRDGDRFVYDLELRDASGRAVERWEGLRLKAVERLPQPAAWKLALLGPYVERRLRELVPEARASILFVPAGGNGRAAAGHLLAGGNGASPHHLFRRPDGRPETANGETVSLSHAGDLMLAVAGGPGIGCDLEPVSARTATVWGDLLGPERSLLAQVLAAEAGEDADSAATRVWAAVECLKKASAPVTAPLVLAGASPSRTSDGWVVLRSGAFAVGTLLAAVEGRAEPLVIAVATRSDA